MKFLRAAMLFFPFICSGVFAQEIVSGVVKSNFSAEPGLQSFTLTLDSPIQGATQRITEVAVIYCLSGCPMPTAMLAIPQNAIGTPVKVQLRGLAPLSTNSSWYPTAITASEIIGTVQTAVSPIESWPGINVKTADVTFENPLLIQTYWGLKTVTRSPVPYCISKCPTITRLSSLLIPALSAVRIRPVLDSLVFGDLSFPIEIAPLVADTFSLRRAHTNGKNVKVVLTHPYNELTHGRVSPNGKRITFTQFHKRQVLGLAEETGGYVNTSIGIVNSDGSQPQVLVTNQIGTLSCNSSWVNDSTVVYLSTEGNGQTKIFLIDVTTRTKVQVPIPAELRPSDPHILGPWIVFPSRGQGAPDSLYAMKLDGTNLTRLTAPTHPASTTPEEINYGDYDPRFSPDGTRIAFMRYQGGRLWHVMELDLKSGLEKGLSASLDNDATPAWSPDSHTLVLQHFDLSQSTATGIYTMRSDGGARTMLPFAPNANSHPSFLNAGEILYSQKRYD